MQIKLRPSDAHRWLVCRASPAYVARLEAEGRLPKVEYAYTKEGQVAHELAAKLLTGQPADAAADKDMLAHVQAYVAFVRKQATRQSCSELLVEHRVEVYYAAERHGYVDAAVVCVDGTELCIIDLKYGRGVSVKAERNPQLTIYTKSLVEQIKALYPIDRKTKVHLTIWQPRVSGEKTERTWDTTVSDIYNGCDWIDAVAQDILARPTQQPFEPGEEQCQFCPAAPICEARARDLLGSTDEVLPAVVLDAPAATVLAPPSPETLTAEQLGRILVVADPLRKWLSRVEAHALAVMESGKAIPGQKLVRGQPGRRKWKDAAEAEKLLRGCMPRDQYMHEELVSPAQAETLLKEKRRNQKTWDRFAELVTRPEGGITIAPADDERPAIDAAAEAAEHFDAAGEELL